MRVLRWSGEEEITKDVTKEQIDKALADPRNASVQVYKPGVVVTRSNGRKYRMSERGQWERVK